MSEYIPKPNIKWVNVKVELGMSNYAAKADLKKYNRCWYIKFCKKTDLANLKSNIDKIDIDKLKNVPSNLSKSKNKIDKVDIGK